MDILMIAHFSGDFQGKDNNRFHYLGEMLSKKNNVEIVTSDFSHKKKQTKTFIQERSNLKITLLHEPGYPKNVCLKRIWSHHIFGENVKKYLLKRNQPDVIYCAVPSLDAANVAAHYARGNNIKYIIDIQDLWPEAFYLAFHMPVISSAVFSPIKKMADYIYASADEIVAVSDTYCKRAMQVNNKCERSYTVYLGTDLSDFDNYKGDNSDINKDADEIWLAYCGTLGHNYDLICVFNALIILAKRGIDNLKFLVMGDGPLQEYFKNYACDKGLENVIFTGRLPYAKMCKHLCICDITINPIMAGSVISIINKHADYAASGLPVINTQESKEYRDLVEQYNMGFNCKNGDPNDLADKLELVIKDPKLRYEFGSNARRCAEERFDRKKTYKILTSLIDQEGIDLRAKVNE